MKWDPSPNFPFDLPPKLLPTVASPGLHGESWSSGKISEFSVCFDSAEGECLALFDLLIPKTRDGGSRSTPEVVRPARRVAGRKESARVASGSVEPRVWVRGNGRFAPLLSFGARRVRSPGCP